MNIRLIIYIYFTVSVASLAYSASEKPAVANQSGNIIAVRYGDQRFTLIGSPDFSNLSMYSFTLPLKKAEPKQPTDEIAPPEEKTASIDGAFSLAKADALYAERQFMGALTLVQEVIDQEPGNPRAWAMRGSLFEAMGDHQKAVDDWKKAYDLALPGSALKEELKMQLPR